MELTYHRPKTWPDLLDAIGGLNDYAFVAGGTDLLVKLKRNSFITQNLVDISAVTELQGIAEAGGKITIGAAVTHARLIHSSFIRERAFVLAEAASRIGSPQIRNTATIGGNIVSASPAADSVPALMVLDACVEVDSQGQKVYIALPDFFQGPGKTLLTKGELITAVRITALKPKEGASFIKLGKRKAMAISVVNGAAWVRVENGVIEDVRLAVGAVGPTPLRLPAVEEWLKGRQAGSGVLDDAGKMAIQYARAISDIRSTAEYRRDMVEIVVKRSLGQALQRAGGECAYE
ncbi:MAG: xanthine dehydrogenase family protein subunit M [Dethiobacter sp.]|jgi:carbon-monoxide dehydrogenase medium subunit|nr:xanthine dehydrogenase family protein subunit M [Dethiobacter sp.]